MRPYLSLVEAPKKNSAIGSRIAPELRDRLDAILSRHGSTDSIILENLLTAFCDAVEQIDAVRWPAAVLLAEKLSIAAEDAGKYDAGAGRTSGVPEKVVKEAGAKKKIPSWTSNLKAGPRS